MYTFAPRSPAVSRSGTPARRDDSAAQVAAINDKFAATVAAAYADCASRLEAAQGELNTLYYEANALYGAPGAAELMSQIELAAADLGSLGLRVGSRY